MRTFEFLAGVAREMMKETDLSSQFASLLQMLGQFLELEGACIYLEQTDKPSDALTFSWEKERDTFLKIRQTNEVILAENQWRETLLRDGYYLFTDSEPWQKSVLFPIFFHRNLKGFLRCQGNEQETVWHSDNLNLVKTIAALASSLCERRYYQRELQSSENNFSSLVNTIEDLIMVTDKTGKILFANQAVTNKLGYTWTDLQRMTIPEFHPPDKRELAQKYFTEMAQGERERCPLELIKKDGTTMPVETRIWFGSWNGRECIFGLTKDLSKESELLERFTRFFENSEALMAITSYPERKYLDINKAFATRLGYSKEEVLGRTSAELGLAMHPRQHTEIANILAKYGRISNQEMQVRSKYGQVLDGLFSGEVVDIQGKQYFFTIMTDITELKSLQRNLDNQRDRLQNILDSNNLGTWEWDIPDGKTIFNETWANLVGYTLAELEPTTIGTWMNLLHPEDLVISQAHLQDHFDGKTEIYDCEIRMRHKKGHWVWIHDRGKVVTRDKDGRPLMMFGTHADISERKKIHEYQTEIRRLKKTVRLQSIFKSFIGQSEKIHHLFEQLERIVDKKINVLIQGESGTGKELIARILHDSSPLRPGPFVTVNSSAISLDLAESLLFGHKKGAFTGATGDTVGFFEQANGGTIFLDEIGDMPLEVQAKILRILEEGKVRPVGSREDHFIEFRVIAATNKNLFTAMQSQQFRGDLYHRLNEFTIVLPPLRERVEDIPLLVEFFLKEISDFYNLEPMTVADEVIAYLQQQEWPGNVRELKNLIQKLALLCNHNLIDMETVTYALPVWGGDPPKQTVQPSKTDSIESLASLENQTIHRILEKNQFHKGKSAQELGISRSTLYRKLKKEPN